MNFKDYGCILNMIESIDKIMNYSKKFNDPTDFYNDSIAFDASMMNFIVIGEMVDKISEEIREKSLETIEWHRIKGFRNIIAHNYFGIDAEEVWQIIKLSLPRLRANLEELIKV